MRMACGRFVAGVAGPRARRRDRRSGCRHGRPDDRRPAPSGTMDHGRVARPRRAIAITEPSYWVSEIIHGTWSARYELPLQLSNASELVAAAALWWPKPILVELTY